MVIIMFTLSECTLMEPTLVAPTAVIEKNPCSHSPTYTALSFNTNKSGSKRAIFGLTLNSSPIRVITILKCFICYIEIKINLSTHIPWKCLRNLTVHWAGE